MITINKEQAEELFRRESILIESEDCVLLSCVTELFGESATKFVLELDKLSPGKRIKRIGVDEFCFSVVTHQGFLEAVSYSNASQIFRRIGDKSIGADGEKQNPERLHVINGGYFSPSKKNHQQSKGDLGNK